MTELTDHQKDILLALARQTVDAVVNRKDIPRSQEYDPILDQCRGVFVTLKTGGMLRGCMGRFEADSPLGDLIPEMAKASAAEDPRFTRNRLTSDELPDLTIEISVLSPLQRTLDPLSITPGVHGIYIRRGYASGCFLPQVATEMNWSAREFLSCCASHKAGLSPDAWEDPDTEVYTFIANVFSEKDSSERS